MSEEDCNNHDHTDQGVCLEVEWTGAAEERYEKSEAKAHMSQDAQQEYIKNVNRINRARVAEQNKPPF